MIHRRSLLVLLVVIATQPIRPFFGEEPWRVFDTASRSSLRGLAAVSQDLVWACGSQGTIIRTTDGGKHWTSVSVPGLEKVEFRSIHSWDQNRAIVATAGQPAVILKTIDGGLTWTKVYEHLSPQAFFDGLKFVDDSAGIAFSDPVDGGLLIVKTNDKGDSWTPIESRTIPKVEAGEAGFAASNSSLFVMDERVWIGLGGGSGGVSRVFRSIDRGQSWVAERVPPMQRSPSAGIFSIAFDQKLHGVCVGGDYLKDSNDEGNVAISDDDGLTWRAPKINRPRGFRSCVVIVRVQSGTSKAESNVWIACGPKGSDWSSDGESWKILSETGFHTLCVSNDNHVWAAGSEGRVARMSHAALFRDDPKN